MNEATVTYCSPFVPAEWIAAHGLTPRRVVPTQEAHGIRQGHCPFARAFAQELERSDAAGAVFTTTCDQMRRVCENVRRPGLCVFLMNVPVTWPRAVGPRMYRDELCRLGKFLQTLGGEVPDSSRLAAVVKDYDQARTRLLRARLSAREFQESLRAINQLPPEQVRSWSPPPSTRPEPKGVPLAIVGGPIPQESLQLLDEIELAGGRVVLDATETGRRGMCATPDFAAMAADGLSELTRMYFDAIPDAFRRPNTLLYEWLSRELSAARPSGIILIHQVWCDLWHAELERLRGALGLPVLQIVDGGDESARASARTRIQSFVEMLR